jgi:hypothetical protein
MGVSYPKAKPMFASEGIIRLRYYFHVEGLSDAALAVVLSRERIALTASQIQSIRLNNDMKRRYRERGERTEITRRFEVWFRENIQQISISTGLGRTFFHNCARLKSDISVPQDMAHVQYTSIFPDQTSQRRFGDDGKKVRRNFWSLSPNFLWSLDGYAKLSPYGFQIYACIDAYSRRIMWIYVGRSATTAIS